MTPRDDTATTIAFFIRHLESLNRLGGPYDGWLMLSKEGQEVVIKDGYMPLGAKQVTEELAKISK